MFLILLSHFSFYAIRVPTFVAALLCIRRRFALRLAVEIFRFVQTADGNSWNHHRDSIVCRLVTRRVWPARLASLSSIRRRGDVITCEDLMPSFLVWSRESAVICVICPYSVADEKMYAFALRLSLSLYL